MRHRLRLPIILAMSCCAAGAGLARAADERPAVGSVVALVEFSERSVCRRAVLRLRQVCATLASRYDPIEIGRVEIGRFENRPVEIGRVEIGRIDVDRDGRRDLVVRRQSLLTCGSHGCSTDVYLRRAGGYVLAQPPLVTAGPILTCSSRGGHGLRPATARPALCFVFRSKP